MINITNQSVKLDVKQNGNKVVERWLRKFEQLGYTTPDSSHHP